MAKHRPLHAVTLPSNWALLRTQDNQWQAKYKGRVIEQRNSQAAAVVFIFSHKLTSAQLLKETSNALHMKELDAWTVREEKTNG